MKKLIGIATMLVLALAVMPVFGQEINTPDTKESVSVLYVQTSAGSVAMHDFGTPDDCQSAADTIIATVPKGKKNTPEVTAFCLPSTTLYIINGGYGSPIGRGN